MNNIIVFATYWNEINWIKPSLKQIEKINPIEMIICDGCFDPKIQNYSTDGTREIIKAWVRKRKNARMISAIRMPRILGCFRLCKNFNFPNLIRIPLAISAIRKSVYRINQALTFNYMISISKQWKVGRWFMTIDADQFYPERMINKFISQVNKKNNKLGLLTGKEYTFFNNFYEYTEDYESREYNNFPHRIYNNTFIKTTRDIIRENIFSFKKYIDEVPYKKLGHYFHYKFRPNNKKRDKDVYALGDRKPPKNIDSFRFKKFRGKHPSVIKESL